MRLSFFEMLKWRTSGTRSASLKRESNDERLSSCALR